MSPFKSKAQMKKAFSGGMGEEMRKKAQQWADETSDIDKLPERIRKKKTPIKGWRK